MLDSYGAAAGTAPRAMGRVADKVAVADGQGTAKAEDTAPFGTPTVTTAGSRPGNALVVDAPEDARAARAAIGEVGSEVAILERHRAAGAKDRTAKGIATNSTVLTVGGLAIRAVRA